LNISNESYASPTVTKDFNLSKHQILVDDNQANNRAEDLEFIGVTFMMLLIALIPVNYFLKLRNSKSNTIKKLNELHIAFIVVAHLMFYSLLGLLLFPPFIEFVGLIGGEKYLHYIVYILFPLYLFLLIKISLHSLSYYLDKDMIAQVNNRLKIIIFSTILFFIFQVLTMKIYWSVFGFAYMDLLYGISFLIGFYLVLNKYFYKK